MECDTEKFFYIVVLLLLNSCGLFTIQTVYEVMERILFFNNNNS